MTCFRPRFCELRETVDLSIVIPCLNEEGTIGKCLDELARVFNSLDGYTWECIVADNGSRDRSREIALMGGARCVEILPEGYGAALRGGMAVAQGEWVIFFDADGTYCLEDLPVLFEATRSAGAAIGIASRFGRKMPPDAMPRLHRYLGTPVLSLLIRVFHGGHVRDCNSGFRCVHRRKFATWGVSALGMEFASELLVRALCAGEKVVEIPSSLRPAPAGRNSSLATWRDGMRHLLVILSHSPRFFERAGIAAVLISLAGQLLATLEESARIGPLEVFGPHTQLLLLGMGILGMQIYSIAFFILISGERMRPTMGITRFLVSLEPAMLL